MIHQVHYIPDRTHVRSHLLHFCPRRTGHAACNVRKSGVASDLRLNHQAAEPFSGKMDTPKYGQAVAPPGC